MPYALKPAVLHDASLHATLVEMWDCGVVLCGPPGSGKSSLALALVAAGHRLVVDDLVLVRRRCARWQGYGVPGWEGKLALRERGVVDVRDLHGPHTTRATADLGAVICLCTDLPETTETTRRLTRYGLPTLNIQRSHIPQMVAQIADWVLALQPVTNESQGLKTA
ncbi:MAG: hypothetical protein OEW08_02205 [Gammaproteobacteria bacterium]|nr:hypothetical protein [Gammaproteobacteria bacterium]